jgi:nitric oxide reductase activation protein
MERVFGKAHRWWKQRRGPRETISENAVYLSDVEVLLGNLARMVCGRALSVRTSEGLGGIRGRVILLPRCIDVSPERAQNRDILLLRTLIAAGQIRAAPSPEESKSSLWQDLQLMHSGLAAISFLTETFGNFENRYATASALALEARAELSELRGRAAALESVRHAVLRREPFDLDEQFERLNRLPKLGTTSPPLLLFGGPLSEDDIQEAIAAEEAETTGTPADGSEFEAPAKDRVERRIVKKDPDADVAPLHLFERVDTVESYNGGSKRMDGSDELEDHLDALDEIDLRQVVRGGDDTHSVFRADLEGLAQIPDVYSIAPGEQGVSYDEWDVGKRSYRPDWVTVYPGEILETDATWGVERLKALAPIRRQLESKIRAHRDAREQLNRQRDGDDIHLPSVVEALANRKAELPASDRVYSRRPLTRRDTATTVLLDLSLSADSWVEGRRVLDVTRDAALLLGEVAHRLNDRLEILAFASHTRNHCRVWSIKGWEDTWNQGQARLGVLAPQGYTRIGPAVRHATAGLRLRRERRRLLLVITDGKPTDFDRYEGRYGIADVGQATREARKDGIAVHALGIDPKAAAALPTMFGVGGWRLLPHIAQLPEALVEAYARATIR